MASKKSALEKANDALLTALIQAGTAGDKQKLEKFLRLTEITPVENNFPLKMQLAAECVQELMLTNDFVFGNFATQVKDTIL